MLLFISLIKAYFIISEKPSFLYPLGYLNSFNNLYASRNSSGSEYGHSPVAYADLEAGVRHLQTERRYLRDDDLLARD